jgi:hypothetical protein
MRRELSQPVLTHFSMRYTSMRSNNPVACTPIRYNTIASNAAPGVTVDKAVAWGGSWWFFGGPIDRYC